MGKTEYIDRHNIAAKIIHQERERGRDPFYYYTPENIMGKSTLRSNGIEHWAQAKRSGS